MTSNKLFVDDYNDDISEEALLAYSYEGESFRSPKVDVKTVFEGLYDAFDPKSAASRRDVARDAGKYCLAFLKEPSVDPVLLEEMLSPAKRLKYAKQFKELRNHTINVVGVVEELDPDLIKRNWDLLVKYDAPIELMVKCAFSNGIYDVTDIDFCCNKKVSGDIIFKNAYETLASWAEIGHVEMLLSSLTKLYNGGLSGIKINKFIKKEACLELLDNIIESPKPWEAIGVKPEEYFDSYIEDYGCEFLTSNIERLDKLTAEQVSRIVFSVSLEDYCDIINSDYEGSALLFLDAVGSHVAVSDLERVLSPLYEGGINEDNVELITALYCHGGNIDGKSLKDYIENNPELDYRDDYLDRIEEYEGGSANDCKESKGCCC